MSDSTQALGESWVIQATNSVNSSQDMLQQEYQTLQRSIAEVQEKTAQTFKVIQKLYKQISAEEVQIERLSQKAQTPFASSKCRLQLQELSQVSQDLCATQNSMQSTCLEYSTMICDSMDHNASNIQQISNAFSMSLSSNNCVEQATMKTQSGIKQLTDMIGSLRDLRRECDIANNEAQLINADNVDAQEHAQTSNALDPMVLAVAAVYLVFALYYF